jgi:glycosyltransferase involved in cell wall biosynthesis
MNRLIRGYMRILAGGSNVMLATGEGKQPPAPSMHWLFATALSEEQVHTVGTRRRTSARSEPAKLIYVGRLSPEKGVEHLLEAFRTVTRIHGTGASATLSLVGDGPDRRRLETLAERLGCSDAVRFCGQMSHSKVLEHLQEADLCVLPSLTESFCKARLDALACGVPVITTAVGFGREIVGSDGERGWIVREGDSSSLVDALRRALSVNGDWEALRARCRRFAEGRTLEAWAERIGMICSQQWGMRLENGKLR